MSYPGFGRGQPQYSPLDSNSGPTYASPATYSQPFPPYNPNHGNAGAPGIEMRPGVQHRQSSQSLNSVSGISSISNVVNFPGPPPGPPPSSSRPIQMHHDSRQSVSPISGAHYDSRHSISSISSISGPRPPLPPREKVHFESSDIPFRPSPKHRESGQSTYSTTSTLFPSPGTPADEQPFLLDPINKVDTTYTLLHVPYNDHTGRQFRKILIGSSFRWFITAGLCAAYIMSTRIWHDKGVLTESQKRMYNAITTAISIALGLNLMSAFKDLALNMRWPILSARKRNLIEMDLILRADSLIQLSKLALMSRRPIVILATISWLLINIAAQAGIAMLNLTYGFEYNTEAVLMDGRNVSIANMKHFWPQGNNTDPSVQDEEYIAHLYGGLAYNYGLNETKYMPKAGQIFRTSDAMLWFDTANSFALLRFAESSPYQLGQPVPQSVYTDRTIKVEYACEAHQVTAGGDGTSNEITVAKVGKVNVSHTVPDSITFFTAEHNLCDGDARCSIVQVFEASKDDPWYYKCAVKVGETQNDTQGYSAISDRMAYIAGSSIAQMGYSDTTGQEAQIYPQNSLWGYPLNGREDYMGQTIATFALGSIAGATLFNPPRYYNGAAPNQGFRLALGHPKFFYLIIGLICGCQLIFCVIVATLANRVMVGPDSHLRMSLLLRPIADALEGVSNGKENSAFRDAKRNTMVRYEKAQNGRWILNMRS